MKRITVFCSGLALALFLLAPVSGHAIIDIGAYGGYNFGGKAYNPTVYGPHLGLISHASFTLAEVVTLGLGAYYQRAYEIKTINYFGFDKKKMTYRDSVGLDGYLQINIPKANLRPYGRVSTNIWDQNEGFRVKNWKNVSISEYFKTYAFGGGLDIPLANIEVLDKFSIYLEYLYTISNVKNTAPYTHTGHAGVRFRI